MKTVKITNYTRSEHNKIFIIIIINKINRSRRKKEKKLFGIDSKDLKEPLISITRL